jgi:hypothetical protein
MYVHLFNRPVSLLLRWADPVEITAAGGVLNFKMTNNRKPPFTYDGSIKVGNESIKNS